MFTRQHYNFMAKRFRENLEPLFKDEEYYREIAESHRMLDKVRLQSQAIVILAVDLARNFQRDNPSFDPVKFLNACSPNEELYPLGELWNGG